MRLRDTIICLLSLAIAAGLIIAAGTRLDYINEQRYKMNLIINEPLKNAPPSLAFATVAMGAFRGLFVDILWMRADKLKEQGQFFDAKQLAEWITILQPRFAAVWEFQAWNMAYNISVEIPATAPHQRWRWVKNGYELIRDKGLVINPKSMLLYRELARIFQHKIGGITDESHKYYKIQLAMAMEPLMGAADNKTFEAMAKAPGELEDIIKDANVAVVIEALRGSDQAFARNKTFVSNYLALRQYPDNFAPEAFETIERFRGKPALQKLDIFAKAWQLRNVWKLEPAMMLELNQTYGPINFDDPNQHFPLDWRHPDTHAIYWAVTGLKKAGKGDFHMDETNVDRTVNHGLQNLFRGGKIFIYDVKLPLEPNGPFSEPGQQLYTKDIFLRSDLRMFAIYNKSVMAKLEKYKTIKKKSTYESFKGGHRNMLVNAAFSFYQAGHIEQARKIYNQLRKLYKRDEFKVPFLTFIKNRLRKELDDITINDAKEIIQMMLRESYFRYSLQDDDEAAGREKMALEIHKVFQQKFPGDERLKLPEFKILRYLALLGFLNDHQYPPGLRQGMFIRMEIERPKLAEQFRKQHEETIRQLEQQQSK